MKNPPKSKPQSKPSNAKPKPPKSAILHKPSTKPKSIILKPNPNKSDELKAKLEKCESEFQLELEALKGENLKLCKQIYQFKAEITTLKSQITILTDEYAKYRHDNPPALSYWDSSEKLKKLEEEIKRLDEEEKRLIAELNEDKESDTQQKHPADRG